MQNETLPVHLTGFPFDKADVLNLNDTLCDRTASWSQILLNNEEKMIGFAMCSCDGDSGGPLWVEIDKKMYLLGVCQGIKSFVLNKSYHLYNVAVPMYKEKKIG